MLKNKTSIDLFDQYLGMVDSICQIYTQMFMDIPGIDLFDQNVGTA